MGMVIVWWRAHGIDPDRQLGGHVHGRSNTQARDRSGVVLDPAVRRILQPWQLVIWQVSGLVALLIGGFWLLMMLAKCKLAPRDERRSPEPLAPGIASAIVVGALVTLGSNAIEEKVEEVPSEPPPLDSPG